MDIKNKKMNFLGDSITEGIGLTDVSKVYWKQFEYNDGCTVRGYGISGTRIARQLDGIEDEYSRYFGSRVAEMDADADIVVVFGGTNDFGHGDAAIGRMSDRSDDTFYGALHNLCISLIEKYPEAQLVVMTPLHRIGEAPYYNSRGVRTAGTLEDYVNIITEVAGYYGIPVLDLYRTSGINPAIQTIREKYMPDGLHPSDAGSMIIYKKLRGFLETL